MEVTNNKMLFSSRKCLV